MRKKSAIALILMASLTVATTPAIAKPKKPTLAEIEAAKKAESAKKKAADTAAKKLASANQTLRALTAKAAAARALYQKAQAELNAQLPLQQPPLPMPQKQR